MFSTEVATAGRRRLLRTAGGAAAVVVPLILAVAVASAKPPPGSGGGGKPGGGSAAQTFEISGATDGLYPTVVRTLHLKLENPHSATVTVETLQIEVGDASPRCTSSNLAVEPVDLPIDLPALGEATVAVTIRLVDDPADACQGARFPLTYTGTASR
jgi:hypothetical protein